MTAPDITGPTATTLAALLGQGRIIDGWSRALTAMALLVILLVPTFAVPPPPVPVLLFGAALLAPVEIYLAIRVGFDAALFRSLGQAADLTTLDKTLTALGLVPASKGGRSLLERAAGARRLLRLQGGILATQLVLLMLSAVTAIVAWNRVAP